jgi:serine protease inhibitor
MKTYLEVFPMKKMIVPILLLTFVLLLAGCTNKSAGEEPRKDDGPSKEGVFSIQAVYADPVGKDKEPGSFLMSNEYSEWFMAYIDKIQESVGKQNGMDKYYEQIQKELLTGKKGENKVCSPLNIYLAVSMLAEVSEGETRAQILDALKVSSIEELRERVMAVWDANYVDTPVLKSILADSLWLRSDMPYKESPLKRLAEDYHASSFSGEMGSDEMTESLRKWIDEGTNGLLTDFTKDIKMDPETVMALVSTLYYKASWGNKFYADETKEAIFHGVAGDSNVDMMHRDSSMLVYDSEKFIAVSLGLADSGAMNLFLPKDGFTPEDIAADVDALKVSLGTAYDNSSYPIVHLYVPKFEVKQKTDLKDALSGLGIKDAFISEKADFSPLTDAVKDIFVSSAEHAALVKIDEEGVTGAAYTDMMMAGSAMPQDEIELVFDRPFFFSVTARDGSLLFAGTVNDIQ